MVRKQKTCKICNTKKQLSNFRHKILKGKPSYERTCKKCSYQLNKQRLIELKEVDLKHYSKLIEKRRNRDTKFYNQNKERINIRNNTYYSRNKEKIRLQRKKYRENNREKVRKWKKVSDTNEGRISISLRRRVRTEIGSGKPWLKLLDCSMENFKKWFEFNFKLDGHLGFTWDNYGSVWSIDHVRPCKSFNMKKKKDVKTCFSWKNTLPVGTLYNQQKNATIKPMDELKLALRLKIFQKKFPPQDNKS